MVMQAGHKESRKSVRRQGRVSGVAGVALLSIGLILLIGVGSYYGFRAYAYSQLDDLNFSVEGPTSDPSATLTDVGPDLTPVLDAPEPALAAAADVVLPSSSRTQSGSGAVETGVASSPILEYAAVYPGIQMHPKYWGQPLWAGTDPYSPDDGGLPEGFRLVSAADAESPPGPTAEARRILIPMIGVDSGVSELRIVNLGDSRAYGDSQEHRGSHT